MKPILTVIVMAAGLWMGETLSSTAPAYSMNEEESRRAPSTELTQMERSPDPAPPSETIEEEPIGAKDALHFESKAYRRTIRKDRQMEALRFHQNTLLSRFQNTDNQGQAFLSFSGDGVDLNLRSPNGAEAPIGHLDPPSGK